MASLNKVLLMGNLTKNPELRYTPGGSAVTDFGLAINRTYTSNGEKKEETCFVDINVWGKQAESVSKYLQKGSPAFIEGRLQLDQWEDKETGKARSRLRVVAERVQFLGAPKNFDDNNPAGDNNNTNFGDAGGYGYNQANQAPPAAPATPQTGVPNVPPPMPGPGANPPQASQNSAFAPQTPPPSGQVAPMQANPGAAAPNQGPAANNMPPQAPAPQNNAFNPSSETEDDIPF